MLVYGATGRPGIGASRKRQFSHRLAQAKFGVGTSLPALQTSGRCLALFGAGFVDGPYSSILIYCLVNFASVNDLLYIQVGHRQCIFLDKLASMRYLIAHEGSEYLVRANGIFYIHL